MSLRRSCRVLGVLSAACALNAQAADNGLLYKVTSSVTLPSTNTWWDYIKMEPHTSRLFMARVQDGLTVFDVDTGKVVTTVENSTGANGPLLLPEYNRGYVAMTDGSLLIFDLKTLKPIERRPLASDGGLNSGVYDPATRQIHMITGSRDAESTWFTLDAATGKLLKTTKFPFRKMDDPAVDGAGSLYAPARYDNILLKLDATTLEETARWNIGCNISKARWQASTRRIIGTCLNDKPLVFSVDPATGKITAQVTVGNALDGMGIDEQRKRIVTSSDHGTLSVVAQKGPDQLELLGAVTTRPGARMSFLDQRNGNVYVVAADYTKPSGENVDEIYHPDTFVVLTYRPQ
jgi:hypothetical protein